MAWYSCRFCFRISAKIPVEAKDSTNKWPQAYMDCSYLVWQTSVRQAETVERMRTIVKNECAKVPALVEGSLTFHNTRQVKGPMG